MNDQAHPNSLEIGNRRLLARIPMSVVPWIAAGALFATNILTLLSVQAQSTGHGALVSVMKALSPDSFDVISRLKSQPAPAAEMKKADDLARQNVTLTERRKALESTVAQLQLENSQIKILNRHHFSRYSAAVRNAAFQTRLVTAVH